MSYTYTKLFSSITESTIWVEPHPVRITWITLLAMADKQGRIFASIPGLANRARVTVDEAEAAIGRFLSPDKYSRTPDHDGRRIEPIDGGWRLLNHGKYRAIQDGESIKESKRRWWRENRGLEKGLEKTRNSRQDSIQAYAYADTDKEESTSTTYARPGKYQPRRNGAVILDREKITFNGLTDDEMLAWQSMFPAISVSDQVARAASWCIANPAKGRKSNYRRFLHSWLSRAQDRGAPIK